jgi:hypothetical protein
MSTEQNGIEVVFVVVFLDPRDVLMIEKLRKDSGNKNSCPNQKSGGKMYSSIIVIMIQKDPTQNNSTSMLLFCYFDWY